MSAREFRVCLKKVIGRYDGQNRLILLLVGFSGPAGKMVSYSKFKECHLALSSLKGNIAAFLGKLEIDDLLSGSLLF